MPHPAAVGGVVAEGAVDRAERARPVHVRQELAQDPAVARRPLGVQPEDKPAIVVCARHVLVGALEIRYVLRRPARCLAQPAAEPPPSRLRWLPGMEVRRWRWRWRRRSGAREAGWWQQRQRSRPPSRQQQADQAEAGEEADEGGQRPHGYMAIREGLVVRCAPDGGVDERVHP